MRYVSKLLAVFTIAAIFGSHQIKAEPIVEHVKPIEKKDRAVGKKTLPSIPSPTETKRIVLREFFRFDTDPTQSEFVNQIVGQPPLIRLVQPSKEELPPASGETDTNADDTSYDDLKPILKISIDIQPSEGELPPDHATPKFDKHRIVSQASNATRHWKDFEFNWEAPVLAHRPLYFEDVNLERYGYTAGILQPAVSTVHFLSRFVASPYLWGAEHSRELDYSFGHYRPGSCAPYHVHRFPVSLKGGVSGAATSVGLIFVLP